MDEFFTVQELVDFLPDIKSKQTVYNWVCEDKIPWLKRGKPLYFNKEAIYKWEKAGRPKN